jgi:hypothetical protein
VGRRGERLAGLGVKAQPYASPSPNQGVQPMPYSVRSAPAFRRG